MSSVAHVWLVCVNCHLERVAQVDASKDKTMRHLGPFVVMVFWQRRAMCLQCARRYGKKDK